jgi:phage terminase large subunit
LPVWAKPLRERSRYKVLKGGRGGGKSYAVADQLILDGAQQPHRILCAREYQASIKDSVHRLLADRIDAWGLGGFYEVQRDEIIGANGTSFIFRGVRQNVQSIKSMTGLTRVWVEEAQTVSEDSWRTLIPTVREEGSEIWLTLNPHRREDASSQRFIESPPDDCIGITVNWRDNPFFPKTLNEERKRDQRLLDPGTYEHIWEGAYLEQSDAQVFANRYRAQEFEPGDNWAGPYYGVDFGFSQDPTAGVRAWIHDERLWVDYDFARVGLELDDTAKALIEALPGIDRHVSRADSARPESISYLKRHGLPGMAGVKKGAGSVEDGIAHLKSYAEIVVHPRCRALLDEFRLYSYAIDRHSGDVLPKIVDAHNHCIDALRYALEPVMRHKSRPQIRSL